MNNNNPDRFTLVAQELVKAVPVTDLLAVYAAKLWFGKPRQGMLWVSCEISVNEDNSLSFRCWGFDSRTSDHMDSDQFCSFCQREAWVVV